MTEPKQTQGQRIAKQYNAAYLTEEELAESIDDALSAERLKAQGLVEALSIIETLPIPEQDNMVAANMRQIAHNALTPYASAADDSNDKGNGNG